MGSFPFKLLLSRKLWGVLHLIKKTGTDVKAHANRDRNASSVFTTQQLGSGNFHRQTTFSYCSFYLAQKHLRSGKDPSWAILTMKWCSQTRVGPHRYNPNFLKAWEQDASLVTDMSQSPKCQIHRFDPQSIVMTISHTSRMWVLLHCNSSLWMCSFPCSPLLIEHHFETNLGTLSAC